MEVYDPGLIFDKDKEFLSRYDAMKCSSSGFLTRTHWWTFQVKQLQRKPERWLQAAANAVNALGLPPAYLMSSNFGSQRQICTVFPASSERYKSLHRRALGLTGVFG